MEEKVKGVRMNCVGDVAKSICTEESDIYASIAEKIGVPLVIRKIPHAMC